MRGGGARNSTTIRHALLKPGRPAECSECRGVGADLYRPEARRAGAGVARPDPKILLLDEWLAGLNPTELKIGIALIEQLRDEGCTIIIVEHVMHAIRSLCDRCIVMSSGAKIAEGTPAEVLADHGVIRAYLGDENA